MKESAALAAIVFLFFTPFFSLMSQPPSPTLSGLFNIESYPLSQGVTRARTVPSGLQENDSRPFELTWTSRDSPEPTVLEDGGEATGDRIIVTASFPHIHEDPQSVIESVSWNVSKGIFFQKSGELVVFDSGYSPLLMDLDEFAWNRVDGVRKGDNVSIVVDFSNGDTDVMAWWAASDNTTWTPANNLLGGLMETESKPEDGWFIADNDGSIMVGIHNSDLMPGNYTLVVDTRQYDSGNGVGNEVVYETWKWWDNITISMDIVGESIGGKEFRFRFSNLSINNFFSPKVENVTVSGDPVCEFSWDIYDLNQDDDHYSDLLISADGGASFQIIAANITEQRFAWDSTGFPRDSYLGKIRVHDNDPELNPNVTESSHRLGLEITRQFYFYGGTVTSGGPPPVSWSDEDTVHTTVLPDSFYETEVALMGLGVGIIIGVAVILMIRAKVSDGRQDPR